MSSTLLKRGKRVAKLVEKLARDVSAEKRARQVEIEAAQRTLEAQQDTITAPETQRVDDDNIRAQARAEAFGEVLTIIRQEGYAEFPDGKLLPSSEDVECIELAVKELAGGAEMSEHRRPTGLGGVMRAGVVLWVVALSAFAAWAWP